MEGLRGNWGWIVGWIVSVYPKLIHGQMWISMYFAHIWILTRLPELISLFTPPWFLQPSSACWKVPRVSRPWSGTNPWVLQPRTFLSFLCQATLCDYCSQVVDSDWVTALDRGGWISQPGQNSTSWKRKMSILGSDINVTPLTSQEKTPCSLLISHLLIKTNERKEQQ